MEFFLAYADVGDSGAGNLTFIVSAVGVVVATVVFVLILWGVSRYRRHRWADSITAAAILWGIIAAGSAIYAVDSQMKWSEEHTLQLETGYLDPHNQSGRPLLPWTLWTGLVAAYGAVLVWSVLG